MIRQKNIEDGKNSQEARWDLRACEFNKHQIKSKQKLPKDIVDYLICQYPSIESVLDVGGGAGRYALLFAEKVKNILMTDISNNMIRYARENAKNKGIKNIEFVKIDWESDIKTEIEAQGFDLVFASMCPATRTIEGIEKMMNYSKQYCAVNQFMMLKDSMADFIRESTFKDSKDIEAKTKITRDPHNDRDTVEKLFTHLWRGGYSPEIKIFEEQSTVSMTVDEAKKYYLNNPRIHIQNKELADSLIEEYSIQGICEVEHRSKSAIIIWDIKKESRNEKNLP